MSDKYKVWLGHIFVISWMVNFLSFIIISGSFGGYALYGKIELGHYYLGLAKGRQRFVEVSEQVFNYSHWHGLVTLISVPCVCLCLYWISRVQKRMKTQGNTFPFDMTSD